MDTFNEVMAALPTLRGYAYRLTGSSHGADDLMQETALRAWKYRESFRVGSNARAWLQRIMYTSFLNQMTRIREEQDVSGLAEKIVEAPSQEWHVELADMRTKIAKLSAPVQRLVEMLAQGFSMEEMALASGEHVGTVKSRISRAREKLGLRRVQPSWSR